MAVGYFKLSSEAMLLVDSRCFGSRWVVERTFGWLMKFRRLSKDYEETVKSSEAWILLAMTNIMVRRLATST